MSDDVSKLIKGHPNAETNRDTLDQMAQHGVFTATGHSAYLQALKLLIDYRLKTGSSDNEAPRAIRIVVDGKEGRKKRRKDGRKKHT